MTENMSDKEKVAFAIVFLMQLAHYLESSSNSSLAASVKSVIEILDRESN